jgi:hypothetical protein
MIYGRTSHSFGHLTSNVDYFSDDSLIHKRNDKDVPLGYCRYEHIERFDFYIGDKFDNILFLVNKLNCFLDF